MHEDIVGKLQRHKNRNSPAAAITIIIVFFSFWSFVILIMWLPILLILWVSLFMALILAIVWNEKKQESLINSVKSWKVIVIETNIIEFVNVEDGYYIVSSDWSNRYKSNILERAFLSKDDSNGDENKRNEILNSPSGNFQIWDKISVYFDPNNPKNYFVNL